MSYLDFTLELASNINQNASNARTSVENSFRNVLDLQNGKSFEDILAQNKSDLMAKNSFNADENMFSDRELTLEEYMSEFEKSSINGISGEDILAAFSEHAYGLDKDKEAEENALNTDIMNFLSPYGMADGANISEDELRFNLDEVNALIAKMKEAGFNESNVFNAMKDAANNVNGISANELQALAAGTIFGVDKELTLRQKEDLLSFAQKFTADSQIAKDIASQLQTSNPTNALDSIANAIDKNAQMTFSKDEMKALMASMQMSKEQQAKVLSFFGDAQNVTVDKEAFNMLFAGVRQDLAKQEKSFGDFSNAFSSEVASVEDMVQERLNAALSAQNAGDKQSEVTRKLMEHNLITNVVDGLRHNTLSGDKTLDAMMAELSIKDSINEKDIKSSLAKHGPQSMADSLKSAMDLRNADTSSNNREEGSSKKDSNITFASFLGNIQADKAGNTSNLTSTQNAQNVFSQLENSILTATKKNITTLEVKLNPVELGALNIVLTMKNGEMSALIQPEKIETMSMINKQIDALKAELAEQGVKLDKVEVELKSSNDSSSSMLADAQQEQSFGQEGNSQQAYEQLNSQLNDLSKLRTLGRDFTSETSVEGIGENEQDLAQNLLDNGMVEEENYVFDTSSSINLLA